MIKALVLSGVGCTHKIWDLVQKQLVNWDLTVLDYPREVTLKAESLDEIADWLTAAVPIEKYDCAIGHSMGGLVLLRAYHSRSHFPVILVESNLRPAELFFRSLLMPEYKKSFGAELMEDMRREFPYYTQKLRSSLQKDFDNTQFVFRAKADIYGIYGDRGVRPERIADLNLPPEVLAKMTLAFVANSAHMPMLENPRGLSGQIRRWMEERR